MTRLVEITLTRAEAVALSHAIGNSIDDEDSRKALFPHPAQRAAVVRGAQKLDDAIYGRVRA